MPVCLTHNTFVALFQRIGIHFAVKRALMKAKVAVASKVIQSVIVSSPPNTCNNGHVPFRQVSVAMKIHSLSPRTTGQ